MKLIIDIPDEVYKATSKFDVKYEYTIKIPLEVIANAIPLDDIKAEIQKEIEWAKDHGCYEWLGVYDVVLDIIDKHIRKEKEKNE